MNEMVDELRQRLSSQQIDRDRYTAEYDELMLLFFNAGRLPKGPSAATVFRGVFSYASKHEDAELFERALEGMKQRFADEPRWQGQFGRYEAMLEELRGR